PVEIPADAPRVRIGAVQGNVPQDAKWVRERFATTLADYEEGTRVAAEQGARLVAWPESAITRLLELDGAVRERIEALARSTGAALVVGSVGSDTDALGRVTDYYDSAFAVAPDGGWVDRYDKTHLVPFGEYLPLRSLLERIATAIATGIARGDVTAGERPRAVDVPLAGGAADGIEAARAAGRVPASVRIGIPVCYELLFPDLVRRFARDGASVLVAITNDAWYGRTGAPYQFLAMTALRSAETGLWTVRAANTGVSAVIDERGRVREETRIFEPAVLVADVPLRTAAGGATPYVRFGDVFAYGCYVVAACAGLVARRGAARSAGGADAAEG
ncbi:MAG: apolipoprotein N-acyltransferase, partial [Myxococcales bacterium]|nr:apolipoprotein N-acyltransferase [Myxococcales bacterium]